MEESEVKVGMSTLLTLNKEVNGLQKDVATLLATVFPPPVPEPPTVTGLTEPSEADTEGEASVPGKKGTKGKKG